MKISFYKYNGVKKKIDKPLSEPLIIENVVVKNNYELSNLELQLINSNLSDDYNYCYIHDLNRFYFVEKITHCNGNIKTFHIKCDVLKTYANEIKNATAIIIQSSNPNNNFVDCDKSNDFTTETLALNDNFNHSGNLILVTSIGG